MKKYISVLAIIFIISLAACSNQTISSTPTGNESNIQSNSITTLDKGIWPVNEYTEGLPIPPGTVAWATLDTEHENCSVNLTGISDDDYSEYMEVLNQEGFSVIENVSEEIEEGNYVSIGTLLSNEDKWLSISYIPDSLTISDCRQNAFGQHSRSVFLVFGSKSVYLINNKHFWVPLFPFLAIIFASFFRFMQANVSPTFISIRAFPIICV